MKKRKTDWRTPIIVLLALIVLLFGINFWMDYELQNNPHLDDYENDYQKPDYSKPEYTPPSTTAPYRNIPKHFEWSYGWYDWTFDITIPSQNYNIYLNKPREDARSSYYLTYDDPNIISIADELSRISEEKEFTKADFVASFIQSLHYVPDEQIGYDEYPKFPIETLVEETGDCEDMSYLTASILLAMNLDAVLIMFDNHMAVGVWCSNCEGFYYEYKGREYFYLETTGEGYRIGEIPKEYENEEARILRL